MSALTPLRTGQLQLGIKEVEESGLREAFGGLVGQIDSDEAALFERFSGKSTDDLHIGRGKCLPISSQEPLNS